MQYRGDDTKRFRRIPNALFDIYVTTLREEHAMTYAKVDNPDPERNEMQELWREKLKEKKGVHQTLFNLSIDRIAILDAIAAEIYAENPHNPPRELSSKYIGRQAAVDFLIDQWLDRATEQQTNLMMEMFDRRLQNSEFFRREATWRRCLNPRKGTKREITKPAPPWSGNLDFFSKKDESSNTIFRMISDSSPIEHEKWFPGYVEGSEFPAESEDDANQWLHYKCIEAGTHDDPLYCDLGPTAIKAKPKD